MNDYKFYTNEKCEYFPCHKTDNKDDFSCMFCYCPLYLMGKECGGNYRYTAKGIKDCSDCLFPHNKDNYEKINEKLQGWTIMKNKEAFYNIKLIITDLDHTLLKDEVSIPECYIDTFKKLKEAGYTIAFASARGFFQTIEFCYKLRPDYVICDNGGSICKYDYYNHKKEVILEHKIPKETKDDIMEHLSRTEDLILLIESGTDIYYTNIPGSEKYSKEYVDYYNWSTKEYPCFDFHEIHSIKDLPDDLELTRICTFTHISSKETKELLNELGEKHNDTLHFVRSFSTTLEYECSNKGASLIYLLNMLGFEKKNVISFGDSASDVTMLKESGIAVAVENAADATKACADYICESVFDEGVDKFIKENLLNE